MKSPIEVIIGLKEFEDSEEFQRLRAIEDPEAQGYASGSILASILGATPEELLQSMVDSPSIIMHAERDKGVKRWCHDNIAKDDESH